MIVTTYCTAQSLTLQLISSDELLVLLCVIEVTLGAGGGSTRVIKIIIKLEFFGTRNPGRCNRAFLLGLTMNTILPIIGCAIPSSNWLCSN